MLGAFQLFNGNPGSLVSILIAGGITYYLFQPEVKAAFGRHLAVVAQSRIGNQVVIRASAELRAALDSLADEAGLLQRALFGQVLDVGGSLDPIEVVGREQELGQQALRLGAKALALRLGTQLDAEVPGL